MHDTLGTDLQHGLNRSRRRARRLVGTAAVLAAASPFALAARPAGAFVRPSSASASLTFLSYTGETVTCTLDGFSSRDNEGARRGFAQNLTYADEGFTPLCEGDQYLDASYTDSGGVTRTINSFAYNTDEASFGWDGAYSTVRVTHRVEFTNCDPGQNTTCILSVNTAPK